MAMRPDQQYVIIAMTKGSRFPPALEHRMLVEVADGTVHEQWRLGIGDEAEPMVFGPYGSPEEAEQQKDELLLRSTAENMPDPGEADDPEMAEVLALEAYVVPMIGALVEAFFQRPTGG